jgi:hypothetical protein
MHTCPLVSALAKSFFTPTLLTFLSSISSTILCTLISPSLSIVYLPLFLYQSFYLISPPPINYRPSPSFVRSLALFLSLSPGGLSLSLSLTPSLSFSLSLSLSVWSAFSVGSISCQTSSLLNFSSPLSLLLPLYLTLSPSPSPSLLSRSCLARSLSHALSRSLMFVCSSEVSCLTIHTPTHPHTHALSKSNLCPPSFLLQVPPHLL